MQRKWKCFEYFAKQMKVLWETWVIRSGFAKKMKELNWGIWVKRSCFAKKMKVFWVFCKANESIMRNMSNKEWFCKENERVLRNMSKDFVLQTKWKGFERRYSEHGNQKEFTVSVHIHMGTCIGNSVCEIVPQCSTMLPKFQLHLQRLILAVPKFLCYFLVLV